MPEATVIDSKPTVTVDPFDSTEFKVEPIVIDDKSKPVITDDKNKPEIVDDKNKPSNVDDKNKPEIIDDKNNSVEDGRNFLKEKLGFEDWDSAKKEIETLKSKPPVTAEIKYESLDTKKIKEIYYVIDKKERIDSLISASVDKNTAADIMKLKLEAENPGLKKDQIEYKFNRQYGLPKEPVQRKMEEDDEFEERKQDWEQQVKNIENDLLVDAEIAKSVLNKISSELKIPEIKTNESKKELTPEELAKLQDGINLFLQDADTEVKKFEGFTATYKDKDVEVQSSYKLSDDENKVVLSKVQKFAESGYNANAIFMERWVKDGNFDFTQMAKDLAAIETDERRSQRYISDTYAKAKLQFIKGKHNIELNTETGKGELQVEDKTEQQKSEDAVWA